MSAPARPHDAGEIRQGCVTSHLSTASVVISSIVHFLAQGSLSRATVAGGFVVSPSFVPVPPSIRADQISDRAPYTLFVKRRLEARAERRRAHLMDDVPVERQEASRSPPPALSALDSLSKPSSIRLRWKTPFGTHLIKSRCPLQMHRQLLSLQPRSWRRLTGLQVPPQRDQQLASQGHDPHLAEPPISQAKATLVPLAQFAAGLMA